MKILAVGDLHYSLRQYDWVLEAAADADLVIIVGDLLDIAGHLDLDTQITVVTKYLDRLRERSELLVCSGNHDGDGRDGSGESVAGWLRGILAENLHGDGTSVTRGDWLFSVCPWWDGPHTREALEQFLADEAVRPRRRWFVVHHSPPQGSPVSWTGKRDVGDAMLREFIEAERPDIVLSGHIHNAPFRQGGSWHDRIGPTAVFNAGRQLGDLPTFLKFDLEAGTVRWVSLAGSEEIQLGSG